SIQIYLEHNYIKTIPSITLCNYNEIPISEGQHSIFSRGLNKSVRITRYIDNVHRERIEMKATFSADLKAPLGFSQLLDADHQYLLSKTSSTYECFTLSPSISMVS